MAGRRRSFLPGRGVARVNVLIIPEDFRQDQFILLPLVQRMLREIGKPAANVRVCMDPLLGGVNEALKKERIREVLERYSGMVDLFLLLVDRDGVPQRRKVLDSLGVFAHKLLPGGTCSLLGENAWQEVEVWALAGQSLPRGWTGQEVRAEIHAKERYFHPFVQARGLTNEPGHGRRTLGQEAAANYRRVKKRCQEDIAVLENRLRVWLDSMGGSAT
jgi:hypothetical protein